MSKTLPYKINWKTNTVYVSKRLQDGANQMGTDDFDTMRRLQELNMPIKYQEIHRKPKVPKWSYARMERYVEKLENADKWKAEYQTMKDTSSHGETWSWFRKNFIQVDGKGRRILPTFTADGKIVVPPTAKPAPASNITPISQKATGNGAKTDQNADAPAEKRA